MTCANFTEAHDHVNTWPGPLLEIREGLMPARDPEAYAVLVLWSICLRTGTSSVLKKSHKHSFEKNLFIYYVPGARLSSVQSLSHVRLSVTSWTAACQASLSITNSESSQTHVHRVRDAIHPSHPLSSPSPPALNLSQHQGLFK